jgi:SAM-dependent methyltransferase
MLEEVADLLPGRDLAIEIGCGVGRLLIPMSSRFERVVGVDVAPTMLARLRENCTRFGAANVQPALVDEPWDRPSQADFAYAWLVFQHVADVTAIEALLGRLATALKPRGAALLQFDTRPRTLPYLLRNTVPDALLPWTWRRGIRRIRRAPGQVAALLRAAGLRTLREDGSGTERHVVAAARR